MTTLKNIGKSATELRRIQCITICGVLLALRVVLGFLSFGTDTYRITVSALPVYVSAYLFGPVPAAIVGALGDIVTLIVKPTGPLNIGITLAQALMGFIVGLFIYKRPISIIRTTLGCVISSIVCSLGITTISIVVMYNTQFWAIFPTRAITAAITTPIIIVMLFITQKALAKLPKTITQ